MRGSFDRALGLLATGGAKAIDSGGLSGASSDPPIGFLFAHRHLVVNLISEIRTGLGRALPGKLGSEP